MSLSNYVKELVSSFSIKSLIINPSNINTTQNINLNIVNNSLSLSDLNPFNSNLFKDQELLKSFFNKIKEIIESDVNIVNIENNISEIKSFIIKEIKTKIKKLWEINITEWRLDLSDNNNHKNNNNNNNKN